MWWRAVRRRRADGVPRMEKERGDGLERRPLVGTARRRRADGVPPMEKERGDGLERRPLVGTARRRRADGVPPTEKERGDGLERRPLVGTARRRRADGVSPTEKERGDGLERRPLVGTARRRRADGVPPMEKERGDGLERRPLVGTARRRRVDGVPPTEKERGDGLERRPLVGTARRRRADGEASVLLTVRPAEIRIPALRSRAVDVGRWLWAQLRCPRGCGSPGAQSPAYPPGCAAAGPSPNRPLGRKATSVAPNTGRSTLGATSRTLTRPASPRESLSVSLTACHGPPSRAGKRKSFSVASGVRTGLGTKNSSGASRATKTRDGANATCGDRRSPHWFVTPL